jgi:hypothetical protein
VRLAGLFLLAAVTTGCLCGTGGTVCTVTVANSSFDQFTADPYDGLIAWMRRHYSRMIVYAPAFDGKLSWYPNGWVYKDMYAIHTGSSLAAERPDWILRDASGQPLYIPYACSSGSCPQYAGDIGNPSFRARWISDARVAMAAGYRGLFEDDFNMRLQVGDGSGQLMRPMNPRTAQLMSDDEWRSYMADFATEIRRAFPHAELVQNQVYFFASPSNPDVVRATRQANYVWIERGFNDAGIVGGTGRYGFETLLAFVDAVHGQGAGTIEEIQTPAGREYALACYFLTSTGADGLANRFTGGPASWWSANDVDLGDPHWLTGRYGRYRWNGLFRRDFTRGVVLVNQPGSPAVTVDLGKAYGRLDGTIATRVTVDAADGVVLTTP